MTCVESQFLATVDPVKVAAAGALGRMFGRGLGQGGLLSKGLGMGMGAKLTGSAGALARPAPGMARATPVTRPMQRMMGNPDFQEVMSASQSGFPKLPGMNLMSPSTQQGILRPGAMKALGPSGAGGQMQRNLASARPAMAKTIRGFRGMQRQGMM